MTPHRTRADVLLVQRGLFDSRARAQAAIAAGLVTANGAVVRKASETIPDDAVVQAQAAFPYVSRGGVKLAGALDQFGVDPAGRSCLDVGSSTGGFTDVLLRRGARHVTAVDSGTGQMHASLAGHPRLTLLEGCDIRKLDAGVLDGPPDLAVIDVSFISLRLVLPVVAGLLAERAQIVALIKPQFEVGRAHIGKGGIVRDEAARQDAVEKVIGVFESLGFCVTGTMASTIAGGDGNQEYLVATARGAEQ